MDGLELVVKATREELWVEDRGTGARLQLPPAFWRSLSEQLKKTDYLAENLIPKNPAY